jgi:hypothetical protein
MREKLHGVRSVLLAVLGVGFAIGMFWLVPAGPTGATPKPSPNVVSDPALGLNISLLGINVKATVPLTVNGLLGVSSSTSTPVTPPPTTPPPTSPPPSTSTPVTPPPTTPPPTSPPPSSSRPRATPTSDSGGNGPNGQPGGGSGPTSSSSSSSPASSSTTPTSTPPSSSHTRLPTGAIVLTRRLLPNSDVVLLISVLVATSLAVAGVVRMSGRRGNRA